MDRSPFRTLMTKNFPSAPPSLQLLEDLFIRKRRFDPTFSRRDG